MPSAAVISASPYPVAQDRAIHAAAGKARRSSVAMRTASASGLPPLAAYDDQASAPVESTSTALVVVDPASMPRKQGPVTAARSTRRVRARPCRARKADSAASSANRGRRRSTSGEDSWQSPRARSRSSPNVTVAPTGAAMAAPMATKRCACAGTRTFSGASRSVSMNSRRVSGRKCSGPPRKATVPRMGLPQASPPMVWFTTAWRMLAAMSSRRAPSLMSGCTSVFANTPQRAAMG